jgi:hypothetical protein
MPKKLFAIAIVSGGLLLSQQQWPAKSQQPLPVPAYTAADEKIVWTSGPAEPGDSVVVTGAFSREPKTIELASLSHVKGNWEAAVDRTASTAKPVSQGPESIVFQLPNTLPAGATGFRISNSAGVKLYGRVNVPEIYWLMGIPSAAHQNDPGEEVITSAAAKGDLIRVFGCNFGPNPELVLRAANGKEYVVASSFRSKWAVSAVVPAALSDGRYTATIRSEPGNANTGSAPVPVQIVTHREQQVHNLDAKSCGMRGDGVHDDSAAIQNCLDRAAKTGTAVIQFDAKTYLLEHTLSIPSHVYLRGAGQGKTIFKAKITAASASLFSGSSYFGLSCLTIDSPSVPRVLATETGNAGHILIDSVTISGVDQNAIPKSLPDRGTQLKLSAALARGDKDTVNLTGGDIRILNSEIVSAGRALVITNAHGLYLSGDVITDGPYGWYSIVNSTDVIFEKSRVNGVNDMASGGSYAGTIGISENIYTDGNTYERMPAANGEAFTSDGPGGAYFGTLNSVKGAHLELAGDPNWKNRSWAGSSVAILGGRGAGQYRLIQRWGGRGIDLEKPFDISPDKTSVVTVVPTQRHYILVNNRVTDAGVGLQFYGTIFDSVIADNTLSRSGGIFLHAARYGDGIQPNLFVQVLDNTILRRGTFRGGANNPNVNDPGLVQVQCTPPSLALGIVLRGNRLGPEAMVKVLNRTDSVHGMVVEKNVVTQPANGIQIQQPSARVVIRKSD